MHSSLLAQEQERVRKDYKIIGWLWLFIGIAFFALSFLPSHIGGFRSICIGGFGLAGLGLIYLLTARRLDQRANWWRQWAGIFCGTCVIATIIIVVLENAPMR